MALEGRVGVSEELKVQMVDCGTSVAVPREVLVEILRVLDADTPIAHEVRELLKTNG